MAICYNCFWRGTLLIFRLSINMKHLCLFFHSLPILANILKFRSSPPNSPFIKFNKDLHPPVYFDPPPFPPSPLPFIRHLRSFDLTPIVRRALLAYMVFRKEEVYTPPSLQFLLPYRVWGWNLDQWQPVTKGYGRWHHRFSQVNYM